VDVDDKKRALSDRSNEILEEIEELRELEDSKRTVPISTPGFHRLAERITEQSRRIFRMANDQERLGDSTETGDVSINDVDEAEAAVPNPGRIGAEPPA
jgi:hypothetical protein